MQFFPDSIDKYDVLELLGKGGFACVYRARVRQTGTEVAIKMIEKKRMKAARMEKRVNQEVSIHSRLKHPSVLELFTFFEDGDKIYLILELCHNGELRKYLQTTKTTLSEDEARNILRQVVDGLAYLHSYNIVHRDISLSNLLLTKDMTVKIGDFGLAAQLFPNEKHLTMCGTPNYISPEIATRASHGLETDVWGLGIMLYTVLVGKPPFDTDDGVKATLTHVVMTDIEVPSYLSPEAKNLMSSLLKKNPKDRIKLDEILEHPFMNPNGKMLPNSSSGSSIGFSAQMPKSNSYSETVLPSRAQLSLLARPACSNPPTCSAPLQTNFHSWPSSTLRQSESAMTRCCNSGTGHAPVKTNLINSRTRGSSLETSHPQCSSCPSSLVFKEVNCNHAWGQGQCGHCSHIERTCSCIGSRYSSANSSHFTYNECNKSQSNPLQNLAVASISTDLCDKNNNPARTVAPLNSSRLDPIRQKTKHVIFNILDSGELCLEFIKRKHELEKVVEVLRITKDGLRIAIYYPNKGKGIVPTEAPVPMPPGGADSIYSYENLPEKHLKKYSYASRFLELVKAKSAKFIYYTQEAKFTLMENGPDPDFQALFYNGSKAYKSGSEVKIVDVNGLELAIDMNADGVDLPPPMKLIWDQFKEIWAKCRHLEKIFEELERIWNMNFFPVSVGKRPPVQRKVLQPQSQASNKENVSGIVDVNLSSVVSRYEGPTERVRWNSSKSRVLKKVQIPNVGTATQLASGMVILQYPDNSKLLIEPKTSLISLTDSSGNSINIQENDVITAEARQKLAHIQQAIESLTKS